MLSSLSSDITGQETKDPGNPDAMVFHEDSLVLALQTGNQRWMSFIKEENVLAGLYSLKAGEVDGQQPHETDEVYYVIKGRATFAADGKEIKIEKGSVLFVKALVAHQFKEIEEDLILLVFFDQ
jgi:quercetin dioxygenase-like cupin family protein